MLVSTTELTLKCQFKTQVELFATLRSRGRPGRDGCRSALWDCFKDEFAAMLKIRPQNHDVISMVCTLIDP